MDLFDDLISFNSYDPADDAHLAVAEFCFMHIIQKELQDFVTDWNSHRIRKTITSGCPGGIPNELYDLPHLEGFSNHMRAVNEEEVETLFTEASAPLSTTSPYIRSLCIELCAINRRRLPGDRQSAINLFIEIINSIQQ